MDPFAKLGALATPCWWKWFWENLDHHGFDFHLDYPTIPPPLEDDKLLKYVYLSSNLSPQLSEASISVDETEHYLRLWNCHGKWQKYPRPLSHFSYNPLLRHSWTLRSNCHLWMTGSSHANSEQYSTRRASLYTIILVIEWDHPILGRVSSVTRTCNWPK